MFVETTESDKTALFLTCHPVAHYLSYRSKQGRDGHSEVDPSGSLWLLLSQEN
jgi:hypothetical protein